MQRIAATEEKSKIQSFGVFLAGLAAGVALLYYGRAFCITLGVSVILAFLLEPFVVLFMRARLPRGFAAFLACSIAVLVLYLSGLILVTQLASFADDMPDFTARLNILVDRVAVQLENTERTVYKIFIPKRFQEKPPAAPEPQPPVRRRRREAVPPPEPTPAPIPEVRIQQDRGSLVNYLAGYVSSVYSTLLMISFVPFLVYFMLSWGDHVSRSFLAIYQTSRGARAGRSWTSIANIARAYVLGNVILGLIISTASIAVFWSWHLPYWVLVGFLSGFLSLVPYVGLPLAMIPPVISALMMYDGVTPYVLICAQVAVIHLLAQNLLYPSVVGARVHLNPLTVTIALMFWGTIWGGIGLILAIPVTAALKAYLDNTENLQGYGRLLGDKTSAQAFSTTK